MTMNLGAMALVSVLGVGAAGVVAQQNGYIGATQQPQNNEVQAPEPGSDADPNLPAPETATPAAAMPSAEVDCQSLIAEHQQLTADFDNYDKELERLVSTMKSATGDKAKLDATIGVVEALATQRRDMRTRMSTVHGSTMRYLLSYTADGTNKVPCPMFETAPEDQLKEEQLKKEMAPPEEPEGQ
jgi:hypothetical protein